MEKPPLESGWVDHTDSDSERGGSWAFQLALCLLSSIFFVSYVLLILAPLPFVYLYAGTPDPRRGRIWGAAALAIGVVLSCAVHGWLWGGVSFLLLTALPSITLGELLLRHFSPEKAVMSAVAAVLLASTIGSFGVIHARGLPYLSTIESLSEQMVRQSVESALHLEKVLAPKNAEVAEPANNELKEIQKNPKEEAQLIPGTLLFCLLLLCALPCLALIRWNPKGFLRRTGISRDFIRRWRTPDWFVWPALLCGAALLFDVPYAALFARNLLNSILLIYFFQGMSILAYFLDSLRLRGPIRVLFYGTAILFLTLMVVSFGFFDLWVRFRSRSRFQGKAKDQE
jgi:hypothetical protein